jgi:hypothetical protein
MKKYIAIEEEVLARLVSGKCVEGSLHRDQWTGVITFKAFNRKPRGSQDRLICPLESGWLKESPKRIKFFSSVKKEVGVAEIHNVMERDLDKAMSELFMAKLAEMLGNN